MSSQSAVVPISAEVDTEATSPTAEVETVQIGSATQAQDGEAPTSAPTSPPTSSRNKKKPKLTVAEEHVKGELYSLCYYIVFLFFFFMASWLQRGDEQNYFMMEAVKNDVLYNGFLTGAETPNDFYGTGNFGDMWYFINGEHSPIRGYLMTSVYPSGRTYETWNTSNQLWPGESNMILGGVRIRQVRVKKNSCTVDSQITDQISSCNAQFSLSDEDKEPFGPPDFPEKYQYSTSEEIGETLWIGQLATYSGGGYTIDLPKNESEYKKVVAELQADNWITPYLTRAVFLDFQLYNPAVNLHFTGRCAFEIPHTGGVRSKADFFAVKLNHYIGFWGNLQLACEVVLGIFVLSFIYTELKEMYVLGMKRYCMDMSNFIDWANIMILLCNLGLNIVSYSGLFPSYDVPVNKHDEYVSMMSFMVMAFASNLLSSVNAFILWMKFFNFMHFSPRMQVIFDTMKLASKDLAYFAIMFFIFIVGFAHMGWLCFGHDCKDFRNISQSVISLLNGVMGNIDGEALETSNLYLGPLYNIIFQITMLMILINVFLAIMNDAYTDTAKEAKRNEKGFSSTPVYSLMIKTFMPSKALTLALTTADENDDGRITRKELKEALMRNGMVEAEADIEVDESFDKYDLDKNGYLSLVEVNKILEEKTKNTIDAKKMQEIQKQEKEAEVRRAKIAADDAVKDLDHRASDKEIANTQMMAAISSQLTTLRVILSQNQAELDNIKKVIE